MPATCKHTRVTQAAHGTVDVGYTISHATRNRSTNIPKGLRKANPEFNVSDCVLKLNQHVSVEFPKNVTFFPCLPLDFLLILGPIYVCII